MLNVNEIVTQLQTMRQAPSGRPLTRDISHLDPMVLEIRGLLSANGITQAQVAALIGWQKSYVSGILTGNTAVGKQRLGKLLDLVRALAKDTNA
jgi:predicted XRE-type DNA-binding protein